LPALELLPPPVPPEVQKKRTLPAKITKERLVEAIKLAGGSKAEAARLLGVSRVTLWKWLKTFDIQAEGVIPRQEALL
jgi:transcriptional regulator of acetoin/glycerol metabolism